MAGSVATLLIDIAANTSALKVGMDKARAEVRDFRSSVESAMAGLKSSIVGAAAGFLSFQAASAVVRDMINDVANAEKVTLKLEAVLRATGNTVGYTAAQLDKMSSELASKTLFDDEDIRNAEAQLLTFRNITGTTFRDTLAAALDLSTVMDQDLRSSIVSLGKAINDPVHRLTDLQRVGITFTEQQKAQVAALQESGNLLGAQKVILQELQREFGGGAEGTAGGLTGALAHAHNAWHDFLEQVGKTFVLTAMNTALAGVTGDLRDQTDAIAANDEAIQHWVRTVTAGVVGAVRLAWNSTQVTFRALEKTVIDVLAFLADGMNKLLIGPVNKLFDGMGRIAHIKIPDVLRPQLIPGVEKARAMSAQLGQAMLGDVRDVDSAVRNLVKAYSDVPQAASNAAKHVPPPIPGPSAEDQKAIDDIIKKLKEENDTIGLSAAALLDYQLRLHGASAERRAFAESLRHDNDIKKEMERWTTDLVPQVVQPTTILKVKTQLWGATDADAPPQQLKQFSQDAADTAAEWKKAWASAVDASSQAFANFFQQAFTEGAKLRDFLKGLLVSVANVFATMTSSDLSKGIGHLFGLDVIDAGVQHVGGMAGSGPLRQVPAIAFAGAPRLHNGGWLASDEVPAILQKGERVLSRAEAAGMSSGPTVHVHQTNNFNVGFVDGATGEAWLRTQGMPTILDGVAKAAREAPGFARHIVASGTRR